MKRITLLIFSFVGLTVSAQQIEWAKIIYGDGTLLDYDKNDDKVFLSGLGYTINKTFVSKFDKNGNEINLIGDFILADFTKEQNGFILPDLKQEEMIYAWQKPNWMEALHG